MLLTMKLICRVSCLAVSPYSAPLLSFLLAVKIYHNLIFYLLSDHNPVKVISGYRPEHQVRGGDTCYTNVSQSFLQVQVLLSLAAVEKKLHNYICTA